MSEDSKYYTPTIEEFHIGFEFESDYILFHNGNRLKAESWAKIKLTEDMDWIWEAYRYDAVNTEFRVKHLDREDIESFGFGDDELFSEHTGRFMFHKEDSITPRGKQNVGLYFVPQTYWVMLFFYEASSGAYSVELKGKDSTVNFYKNTAFAGQIKNKSELERVLRQVGVIV